MAWRAHHYSRPQALREGYRSIALRSFNGCPIEGCTLLCHLSLAPLAELQPPAAAAATASFAEPSRPAEAAPSLKWSHLRRSLITLSAFTNTTRRNRVSSGAPSEIPEESSIMSKKPEEGAAAPSAACGDP